MYERMLDRAVYGNRLTMNRVLKSSEGSRLLRSRRGNPDEYASFNSKKKRSNFPVDRELSGKKPLFGNIHPSMETLRDPMDRNYHGI